MGELRHGTFKSCTRKRRFRDVYQARASARKIKKTGGPEMRVYFCENCKGYHLSSIKKKEGEQWET